MWSRARSARSRLRLTPTGRRRWREVEQHGVATFGAIAGIVAAIVYVAKPSAQADTALGDLGGLVVPVWQLMVAIGGVLILRGLWIGQPRVKLYGLCLFAPALMMNGLAILIGRGAVGAGTGGLSLAVGLGLALKARVMFRGLAVAKREMAARRRA